MLKRQSKSDAQHRQPNPVAAERVLIVDDHPEAAQLLSKLSRRAGWEVAVAGDHALAMSTLENQDDQISAIIVSYSGLGNAASLKLLDAVRHTPEARVNRLRMVMVLDGRRQTMFAWQAGADAVILRPYRGSDLTAATAEVIARPDDARLAYRRQMIEELTADVAASSEIAGDDALADTVAAGQVS